MNSYYIFLKNADGVFKQELEAKFTMLKSIIIPS
jgi:hypothetical protein